MPAQERWVAEEPSFAPVALRVLARATRRPFRTLGLALLVTALVVLARVARPPLYRASVTFRMAEGDLHDPRNAPRPPTDIRDYVSSVAMSRERLLPIMERYELSPRLRRASPVAAVASLRENIDVEVFRNYFLFDREEVGQPRSALIVLAFTSSERGTARAVVHDLAAILLETQAAARDRRLAQARSVIANEARHAREHLRALQERRATLLRRRDAARLRPPLLAEELGLAEEIERAARRARDLEARGAEAEFAAGAEEKRLWLSFTLVDESVKILRRPLRGPDLLALSTIAFAAVLPVVATLSGAFDRRIYTGADVALHRFPLLGAVPGLGRGDAGSYRARERGSSGGVEA